MTRDQLIQRLRELLRKQPGFKGDADKIANHTRLDHLEMDSIAMMDFLYDIEADLHVTVEAAELVAMGSVQDLVDHLAAKLAR